MNDQKTPLTNPLDAFEARLLDELRSVVREAAGERVPHKRPWRVLALAGATAVVALGLTAANLLPTSPASPAYAVGRTPSGDVKVTVNRLEDADKLQADLIKAGIPANVTFTKPGFMCADEGWYTEAPRTSGKHTMMSAQVEVGGGQSLILSKDLLQPGQTLVLSSSWPTAETWMMQVGIAVGPVGPCREVKVPRELLAVPPRPTVTSTAVPAGPTKP